MFGRSGGRAGRGVDGEWLIGSCHGALPTGGRAKEAPKDLQEGGDGEATWEQKDCEECQ